MAYIEYWVGSVGPLLIDEDDPRLAELGQMAKMSDIPAVSGVTQDITIVTAIGPPPVTATLHFTNGLLTSVT